MRLAKVVILWMLRQIWCILRILTIAGVLAGWYSVLVRDRIAALHLMLYIPAIPISLVAIFIDYTKSYRAVKGPRFLLTGLSVGLFLSTIIPMIGWRSPKALPEGFTQVRFLQWNTMWGGKMWNHALPFLGGEERVKSKVHEIKPDLMVFSESCNENVLKEICTELGGWHYSFLFRLPDYNYIASLAVISPYPIRQGAYRPVPNGVTQEFDVMMPDRTLRILVVDGNSAPRWRTPFLKAVREVIQKAADNGQPYDIICGDFNSISNSVGFDDFPTAGSGYNEASRTGYQYRGTFPVAYPNLDIDHVFVESKHVVMDCKLFASMATRSPRGDCHHRPSPIQTPHNTTIALKPIKLYNHTELWPRWNCYF